MDTNINVNSSVPPFMEPPEKETIKSMVNIAAIIALIIGILELIMAIFTLGLTIILAIFSLLVYYESKQIIKLLDQRQYTEAKSKTLVWMIVGFIFSFIVVGILLLVAYLKFDDLISKSQFQMTAGMH
jgi:type III secretory pathway component EscU